MEYLLDYIFGGAPHCNWYQKSEIKRKAPPQLCVSYVLTFGLSDRVTKGEILTASNVIT